MILMACVDGRNGMAFNCRRQSRDRAVRAGLQMLTLGGASGAMLYVVFGELLPESFRLCRSPAPVMAAVLGVLTGMGVVLG